MLPNYDKENGTPDMFSGDLGCDQNLSRSFELALQRQEEGLGFEGLGCRV